VSATILVVEDEPQVQELVAVNLEHAGHRVRRASSAGEAVSSIREELPDVLILDWMLPKLDGLEVLKRLRASGKDTHVLILSAKDQVGERVEGLQLGADDYLTKPFAFEELVARIRATSSSNANGFVR